MSIIYFQTHTNLFLLNVDQLFAEEEIDLYELTKSKKSATDKIPVHVALFILQLSKLHMLRFLDFLYDHLISGSYALLYMDTDSYTFALHAEIEHSIKPEMKASFEEKKYNWFLKDNSAFEQRTPGKLKIEAETQNGCFIGLSPKVQKIMVLT